MKHSNRKRHGLLDHVFFRKRCASDAVSRYNVGKTTENLTYMKIITGVGAAVLDHLNLIEAYPQEDGSTHITQIISQGGGACATAIVAAHRLGMHGQMISSVGDDEYGTLILEGLDMEGIDTTMMEIVAGGVSPHSEIMVNPETGTRTKFVCNNTLPPIEWNKDQIAQIRNSDLLHVDGTR